MNVLVICTDQQRWDSLGCYGNEWARTPNIDKFMEGGVLFERCYTPSPVCAPSRATMLTGLLPHQHGLWANGVELSSTETSVVQLLKNEGYRTGLIGKLHVAPCFGGRTEDVGRWGFDYVRWAHDPSHRSPANDYHHWLAEERPELYEWARAEESAEAGAFRHEATRFDRMPAVAHYSRWVSERAISFISEGGDEPWLLWANYFDPHHPFVAPEEYVRLFDSDSLPGPNGDENDLGDRPTVLRLASEDSYAGHARGYKSYSEAEIRTVRQNYYAMVAHLDVEVGRVLDALDATGQAADTMVIFCSDHGEMLGDHGLLLKGPMLYEGAVRVPLGVRWGSGGPVGRRVRELVGLADVPASIMAAAGLERPVSWPGRDLLSVCDGSVRSGVAYSEYRNSGHPYEPPVSTTMLRDDRYKVILWDGAGHDEKDRGELYDLIDDPMEIRNLWSVSEFRSVRCHLVDELARFMVATDVRKGERKAFW